jgi:energy-coupling factor transport system substrate-specific component
VGERGGGQPRAHGLREAGVLPAYGRVAGLAYGALMNLWLWPFTTGLESSVSYVAGAPLTENLARFIAFTLVTSLGFDIPRAVTTAALVAVAARPVLLALRRAARRAELEAVPTFAPPVPDGTMAR